jgi:hypothetical protein
MTARVVPSAQRRARQFTYRVIVGFVAMVTVALALAASAAAVTKVIASPLAPSFTINAWPIEGYVVSGEVRTTHFERSTRFAWPMANSHLGAARPARLTNGRAASSLERVNQHQPFVRRVFIGAEFAS